MQYHDSEDLKRLVEFKQLMHNPVPLLPGCAHSRSQGRGRQSRTGHGSGLARRRAAGRGCCYAWRAGSQVVRLRRGGQAGQRLE